MPRTPSTWHNIVQIPSPELQQKDIPDPAADWGAINEFALTFNGYELWGSFEACADIANECGHRYREDSLLGAELDTLRTCLFFEQRRWRHFGYDPDETTMAYLHAILDHLREIVGRRDVAEFVANRPDD
jgi:hypothetical protein